MPLPTSREWLDRLLEGHELSEAELRQLVQGCPAEDQWIEYKAGAKLREPDPAAFLREYVASFANADGGALVVGCREDRTFDGARAPGGGRLKDWATRALTPIRTGSTLPEPRFAVTAIDGVEVLIVSVGRARMPVADTRSRVPVFFVRMGDQTLEMPQWLVSDLLLSRRAQPDLRVRQVRPTNTDLAPVRASRSAHLMITLSIDYENEALTHAESVRAGIVGWCTNGSDHVLARQLHRSVDLVTPPSDVITGGYPWGRWAIQHIRSAPAAGAIEPFAPGQALLERWQAPLFWRHGFPPLRVGEQRSPDAPAQANGSIEMNAALYLIAKDTEPSWWQLTLRYDQDGKQQLEQRPSRHIRFEPCHYSRPVVSLRFLDEGDTVEYPDVQP